MLMYSLDMFFTATNTVKQPTDDGPDVTCFCHPEQGDFIPVGYDILGHCAVNGTCEAY